MSRNQRRELLQSLARPDHTIDRRAAHELHALLVSEPHLTEEEKFSAFEWTLGFPFAPGLSDGCLEGTTWTICYPSLPLTTTVRLRYDLHILDKDSTSTGTELSQREWIRLKEAETIHLKLVAVWRVAREVIKRLIIEAGGRVKEVISIGKTDKRHLNRALQEEQPGELWILLPCLHRYGPLHRRQGVMLSLDEALDLMETKDTEWRARQEADSREARVVEELLEVEGSLRTA